MCLQNFVFYCENVNIYELFSDYNATGQFIALIYRTLWIIFTIDENLLSTDNMSDAH